MSEAAAPAQAPPRRTSWIVGPWADIALVIATPLALIPLFLLARQGLNTTLLTAFATVLALGHHLPGMMRAYGDKALFRRFRMRFILAPIFLFGISAWCAVKGLHTVLLLAFFWGAWHWMMQSYGFMRIYDGKAGSYDRTTAHLDRAMCIAWFGSALFLAPRPLNQILLMFYESGGPLLPSGLFTAFRWTWIGGTALITLAFVAHALRQTRAGVPPSPIKLVLMAITFVFYGYTLTLVPNGLVAYAMFEMYHDIQYLTIVWLFNRKRAGDANAGGFTRFLFRKRGALVFLYIGLCLAYGSFDFAAKTMESGQLREILLALIVGSSMLHFYFDGFIWKLRDDATGTALGVKGSGKGFKVSNFRHALTWGLFVVPLIVFGSLEARGPRPDEVARREAIMKSLPLNAFAQASLCGVLIQQGEIERARALCDQALALNPGSLTARANQGNIALAEGRLGAAVEIFQEVLERNPDQADAHVGLGAAYARQGRLKDAAQAFNRAIKLNPREFSAHFNLGLAFRDREQWNEAETRFRKALTIQPDSYEAEFNLALCLFRQERFDESLQHYFRAQDLRPEDPAAYYSAGLIRMRQKKLDAAGQLFQAALRKDPRHVSALHHLGSVLVMQKRPREAVPFFQQALAIDPTFEPARKTLQAILKQAQ